MRRISSNRESELDSLLEPLDHILGTRAKTRLLRVLLGRDVPVSGREAARLSGLADRTVRLAFADLSAVGIVERTEKSAQHLFRINRENYLVRHGLEGLFAAERRAVRGVFDQLQELVSRIAQETGVEVLSAILFGSAARGEHGPGSDLDLLLVLPAGSEEGPIQEAFAEHAPALERRFGVTLSPVVTGIDLLRKMRESGEPLAVAAHQQGRRVYGQFVDDVFDFDGPK